MPAREPVPTQSAYRADIDGLRAIAVLSVMAYHYSAPLPWPLLPGGFTGVDVFFVISGFLITSKLNDDIETGTFSILGFYDRRIRRILPALIVMLAVTLFAGKFLLMPGDYEALAASTATAAFGVSNFFFLANTGYFDRAADLMPLLHTWSLGVEEQFYVVWPALLFLISKGRRRIDVAALLGGIVILGLAASLIWFDTDPKAAFFLVAPRAWELAIGAALVFLPPLSRPIGEMATAAGLILIVMGFLLVSAASFPGIAALYPCVGAALVIWPRDRETTSGNWLGRLSPIGLISYSLYLWHWPVWVMYRIYINSGTPRIREAAALAAVSILLATLSYRFVEQPFRKRRWAPSQSVGAGLLACMVIFCGSMYVKSKDGMPERIPDAYEMRSLDAMWEWSCPRYLVMGGLNTVRNFGADWGASRKRYILWGDSHAEHFAPLLAATLSPSDGIAVALYARCPAYLNSSLHEKSLEANYNEMCMAAYRAAIEAIRNREFDGVILAGFWTGQLPYLYDATTPAGTMDAGLRLTETGLLKVVDDIGSAATIAIIGDVPAFQQDPVPCAVLGSLWRSSCSAPVISRDQLEQRQGATYKALQAVADQRQNVTLVLPGIGMCQEASCISKIDGQFLYRDPHHIRRNLPRSVQEQLAAIIGLPKVFDLR
jgi:peptidoglycan/LPS O-acetylase OafA/YrhL